MYHILFYQARILTEMAVNDSYPFKTSTTVLLLSNDKCKHGHKKITCLTKASLTVHLPKTCHHTELTDVSKTTPMPEPNYCN